MLRERLRSPEFLQRVYQQYFRAREVFGTAPAAGHPDPFEAGSQSRAELEQRFFQGLAADLVSGQFKFYPPLGGGRGPVTPGEARNLLANWLVFTLLERTLEALGQRRDSGCSFGRRSGDTRALLQHLRAPAPEGGWNRVLEVNYASALDHLPRRRLVLLLERQHLRLQIFSDLLYQALNRRLLRPSGRSLEVGALGVEGRLAAQLLELYLQQLDLWLLQPERLRPEPRQRRRAGREPPLESWTPPRALRPVRCGARLLLLLRGSEEQCRRLQLSLQRFALGQLELKAPRGGNARLLPLEEGRGVELLGFELRKHPRSRHLSILFQRPQLLRSLAQRGLLKGKGDGDFRALSWKSVLHLPAPELVNAVAHYFWGLALHYGQADNGHEALCLVRHYGLMVAACSLAHKNRSSAQQQLDLFGPQLTLRDGHGQVLGQWPRLLQLRQLEPQRSSLRPPPAKSAEDLLEQLRRWAQSRSRWLLSPPPVEGGPEAGDTPPNPSFFMPVPPSASRRLPPQPLWKFPSPTEDRVNQPDPGPTPPPPSRELLDFLDQIRSCEISAWAPSPEPKPPKPCRKPAGASGTTRGVLRGVPLQALSTGAPSGAPSGGSAGYGGSRRPSGIRPRCSILHPDHGGFSCRSSRLLLRRFFPAGGNPGHNPSSGVVQSFPRYNPAGWRSGATAYGLALLRGWLRPRRSHPEGSRPAADDQRRPRFQPLYRSVPSYHLEFNPAAFGPRQLNHQWLAGLVDGDGHLPADGLSYLAISGGLADRGTLERAQRLLGDGKIIQVPGRNELRLLVNRQATLRRFSERVGPYLRHPTKRAAIRALRKRYGWDSPRESRRPFLANPGHCGGLLESDGHFNLDRSHRSIRNQRGQLERFIYLSPNLGITNNVRTLLAPLQRHFGGALQRKRSRSRGGIPTAWVWVLSNRQQLLHFRAHLELLKLTGPRARRLQLLPEFYALRDRQAFHPGSPHHGEWCRLVALFDRAVPETPNTSAFVEAQAPKLTALLTAGARLPLEPRQPHPHDAAGAETTPNPEVSYDVRLEVLAQDQQLLLQLQQQFGGAVGLLDGQLEQHNRRWRWRLGNRRELEAFATAVAKLPLEEPLRRRLGLLEEFFALRRSAAYRIFSPLHPRWCDLLQRWVGAEDPGTGA